MKRSLLASLLVVAIPLATATGADWPQWRGPDRTGVSPETEWLKQWPPKLVWRATVPVGFGTPVVEGDRLYVTGRAGQGTDVWCCSLDARTGQVQWKGSYRCDRCKKPKNGRVGYCSYSTPAIVGDRIYSHDEHGNLVAFDKATGQCVLRTVVDLGQPKSYGYCGSPLAVGRRLILNASGQGAGVDLDDPKRIVWPEAKTGAAGWPSAVPYTFAGKTYVALLTETAAVGVDPVTGDVAFSHPHGSYRTGQDPIAYGDSILFCKVAGHWIRLKPTAGGVDVVWEMPKLRGPDSGSGVLLGDHVYTPTSNRYILCFDARTGEQRWMHRMVVDSKHDGALIGADGKLIVYWACQLHVFAVSPEGIDAEGREPLDIPDARQHGGIEWAHTAPILANGRIYVRQRDLLLCYEPKGE